MVPDKAIQMDKDMQMEAATRMKEAVQVEKVHSEISFQ